MKGLHSKSHFVMSLCSCHLVGETLLPANEYNSSVSKTMHAEIMNLIQSHDVNNNNHTDRDSSMGIESNDVFCSVVRMGYGKGGKNPVTGVNR